MKMNRELNHPGNGARGRDARRIEDIRAEALAILDRAGRENGLPPDEADALGVHVTREMSVLISGICSKTEGGVSPPLVVLQAFLGGDIEVVFSRELLFEYAYGLSKPTVRDRHNLEFQDFRALLDDIESMGRLQSPSKAARAAPDRTDQHLWNLLYNNYRSVLITRDKRLVNHSPKEGMVIFPRDYIDRHLM